MNNINCTNIFKSVHIGESLNRLWAEAVTLSENSKNSEYALDNHINCGYNEEAQSCPYLISKKEEVRKI